MATGLLLLVLCLPLFFINVSNNHNWGCDFAQYIHQAKNIIEGLPQAETGFISNAERPCTPPQAYPTGFPILLTPVYFLFGNSIKAFSIYISLLLALLAILLFSFYRRSFGVITSVIVIAFVIYNPWTIHFKQQILSDIPFALLTVLIAVLWYFSKNGKVLNFIALGILTGFLIITRTIGFALLIAFALNAAWYLFKYLRTKKKEAINQLKNTTIIIFTASCTYVLLNKVIFHVPGSTNYINAFSTLHLKDIIDNFRYYYNEFASFLYPESRHTFFIKLLEVLTILLLFFGSMIKVKRRPGVFDLFVVIYILVLLVYPCGSQGFRFVFPIFPFLLLYLIKGLKTLNDHLKIKPLYFQIIMVIFLIVQFFPTYSEILANRNVVVEGPQKPEAKEVFTFIKNNLPDSAIIIFNRPRTLTLYTSKRSMFPYIFTSQGETKEKYDSVGAQYFLLNSNDPSNDIEAFIESNNAQLLWQNTSFYLYRKKSG